MSPKLSISRFAIGYVLCALWSSHDDENNLDGVALVDLPAVTLRALVALAESFAYANRDMLDKANELGRDDEHLGHDFWLTHNGHGTGFWDRDLGTVGDALTAQSKRFGERWLYRADNERVYLS